MPAQPPFLRFKRTVKNETKYFTIIDYYTYILW